MSKGTARKRRLQGELATSLRVLIEMVRGDEEYLLGERFTPHAVRTFHLIADTSGGILSRVALMGINDLGRTLSSVQQAIGSVRHRERQLAIQAQEAENERRKSLGLPLLSNGQPKQQLQFA